MAKGGKGTRRTQTPEIVNRRARHQYEIVSTLETGIVLTGSEVKSARGGKVSLAEGYVRVDERLGELKLHGVHIAEYPPAAAANHIPTRVRTLLAHKKEIADLTVQSASKGMTIVPLKMYFKNGRAKVQIGVARGKGKRDKREDVKKREAERDIRRALSKRV